MSSPTPPQFDAEKRLLIALILSTLVLLGTPYLMQEFFPAPSPEVLETLPEATPTAEEPPSTVEEATSEGETGTAAAVEETSAAPRTFRVRNRDLDMLWTNRGAGLTSVVLPGYQLDSGEALELLPGMFRGVEPVPPVLSVSLTDPVLGEELPLAVYELEGVPGDEVRGPAEFRFRYRKGRLDVFRTVSIPAEGFVIDVRTEVKVDGRPVGPVLRLGPGIGGAEAVSGGLMAPPSGDFAMPQAVVRAVGEVSRYGPGDLEEPNSLEGSLEWVAIDSLYFAYALLDGEGIRSVRLDAPEISIVAGEEETKTRLPGASVQLVPSAATRLFLGPKDLEILREIQPSLTDLVDYGWFAILVEPLLYLLKQIYSFVGNYGWAIIILTFLINLALLPIRYKQMSSMQKMSELQPKLKVIQDRYKKLARDDPRRQDMNKEVMALYQEHGVNPLGGCLPLLVQMPFLFAFYRMLASSIELRGAPFIFWIRDLSHADPYYVTPLVMGATMVVQQKMTPATGDPAQRRIMMLMPVMFTFFFLSVSSGLALYFLFSNVFGMLFQVIIQRMSPGRAPQEAKKGSPKKKKSVS